jgi:hypothetical protein
MFYFLIDKYLNDYLSQDPENRAFKIYAIGTVLYLIIHVLLYSSLCDNYNLIMKYRHYLYYLMLIDSLATYLFGNKNKTEQDNDTDEEKENINNQEEKEKEEDNQTNSVLPSNQRLTREQILNKFLVKKQNEKEQEQDKESISINSNVNQEEKEDMIEDIREAKENKQEVKEEESKLMSDTDLLSYNK